jgi:hypothetical protein
VSKVKDGETAIRKYYAAAYVRNTQIETRKREAAAKRKRDERVAGMAKYLKKITKMCMLFFSSLACLPQVLIL